MTQPVIVEWPHSRGLGERWVVFPPVTPADQPWPGVRFFPTRDAAENYAYNSWPKPA